MQDNFLNRQKTQAILDSRPQGVDIPTALKELSNQGFTIEGYNDKPVQSAISNAASIAKSAVGGLASGIGGAALTAEDYLMRKGVEKFGSPELQQRIAQTPSLNEQFNAQYGANENPSVFKGAQLAGEVASLAAPVGAAGKIVKTGAEALGTGQKVSKLAQAATEGASFTTGQGLAENKKQSLEDYAINTGLNVAIPGAGMLAKGVGENVPARIINSLIKPLSKDFAYGKNPGKSVAELVPPANNFEDLIANIKTTLNDVGNRIGSVVSQSPNLKQIDLSYTLKPIDDAIAKASQAKGTNATLIQRLQTVKQDLVDNINNGIDPQSYKGLVGDLTKWTGNISDDALVNKSLKQVYGTTKQSMDDVLSKELTPEQFAQYKADSEAYGNLLSAKNAAEHRDKLVQRQDLISFGAKNSAMLAGLTTAVASGGAGVPAILAGLAGAGIDKALATPAFKTRVASLLSKLAPKEVGTFFDKVPAAKSIFNEEELKQFGSELKKNTKGQMNRGMVNPSELLPKKKVVSEVPDVLYHGTRENFTNFDINKAGKTDSGFAGKGIYFTDNKNIADFFSKGQGDYKTGGNIVEAKVDIKNPLVVNSYSEIGKKLGLDYNTGLAENKLKTAVDIPKKIKENGYDSIIVKDTDSKGNPANEYVVFDNKQAKIIPKVTSLEQEAKKYKTTVNIQDKNDLEYLGRILSQDQIADIKAGKMTNFRGKSY